MCVLLDWLSRRCWRTATPGLNAYTHAYYIMIEWLLHQQFDDFLAAQKQVVREGEVVEKDQNEQLLCLGGPSKASQAAKGES